jgi:heptosyltransferase-2
MKIKNILIIQTAYLGDVILALPMVQTIKNHFPESDIDFLCIPNTAQVLQNNPYLKRIIPYDKKGGDKLDKFIEVLLEIRENNYDAVICPHRFFRSALLTYYSEAKIRIGFYENSLSFLLTHKAKYITDKHEIYRNLDLVKLIPDFDFNENKISFKPELFPLTEQENYINNLLKDYSDIISFAPCSKWFTKQLPLKLSAEIIANLISLGFNIVLLGGKDDSVYCNDLEKTVNDNKLLNLCGKTNVLESYLVIKKSAALITADSAAQHIGNAADIPIVLIYGSTDISFGFYPLTAKYKISEIDSLSCRPCTNHGKTRCPLGHFKCMNELSANKIVELTLQIIN